MVLLQRDLELIDTWAKDGMPENDSTRAHAVKLLTKLVADNDDLHQIIAELVGDDGDVCLPCRAGGHEDCVAASTDVCGCFDADHDEEAL
jgi:hypothetical protein